MGREEDGASLFAVVSGKRPQTEIQKTLFKHKKKLFSQGRLSSSERGCPERMWHHHSWRYSKHTWVWSRAACFIWHCFEQGSWNRGAVQPQLFCGSVKLRYYSHITQRHRHRQICKRQHIFFWVLRHYHIPWLCHMKTMFTLVMPCTMIFEGGRGALVRRHRSWADLHDWGQAVSPCRQV